jgi:hypothetical protein
LELELRLLLSLGALVSESLSTRLDSVRAPDLLCVEERLESEDRLRDELEREDDLPFDLFEELPPDRLLLLLLDRDFCLGILPWLLRTRAEASTLAYPNHAVKTLVTAGNQSAPPVRKGAAGTECQERR